ncbi:MAG TPA: cobalamin-independent methionine synthase II family protein [Xanthobacteraceae bacterium]|nr:cobalamin-independent methionine synthase II family protein [Xanthobacteraceae bacterium]
MAALDTIRTDVVGSLLRPEKLKKARADLDAGKIDAAAYRVIEDEAVDHAIRVQEQAGLDVVTDGEMRRLNFQDSFGVAVSGFDAKESNLKVYEDRVEGASPLRRWDIPQMEHHGTAISHRRPVKQRLKLEKNVPLAEYKAGSSRAKKPLKVTLIGADRIAQRFDYEHSKEIYPDIDAFVADVVSIEREMVGGLVDAGCRYVQIDAPGFTAYVDPPSLERMRARGEDPMENFARSIKAEGDIVRNFDGVTFGIHLCRGNQRSMWHREGKYDEIAERLFNDLPHQRFLLEYDTPRAGSFEPLRFMPKGKTVVLGLVSTKVPELETKDHLKRRIEEATKFIPLEQLAISPQCGFASDVVGNLLSEDEQRRKLEVVAQTAEEVWGH